MADVDMGMIRPAGEVGYGRTLDFMGANEQSLSFAAVKWKEMILHPHF